MGFFNKLKERLFTLQPTEEKPKKPETKGQKVVVEKEAPKENKTIDKEIQKQLIKEKKIDKYVAGMEKSGSSFSRRIKEIQARHNKIDEEFFEELEEALILSDVSVSFVMQIIAEIKKEVKIENVSDPKLISEIIADKMFSVYANQSVVDTTLDIQDGRVNVIMMIGVNGVGKTTTIAKLAHKYISEGKKVLIAAADTFRAGAVAQLAVWAERVNADIVMSEKESADPASVVFDAVNKAKEGNYELLIIDTAGRLQNKVNLMNELEKMVRIVTRVIPDAPHETLLVLDATTGQNGVSQATSFKEVAPITGIVLTKMDGTSKGGIVLTIKDKLGLAVKLVGLGEKLDDLQEFDLDSFIYSLTKDLVEEK